MYRFRKVKFYDHPILKNLELDFCGEDGRAVDTIIIAGENGTGKSTLMESIYQIVSKAIKFNADIELEVGEEVRKITYRKETNASGSLLIHVKDNKGLNTYTNTIGNTLHQAYPLCGVYSDVDINFHAQPVSSVTSNSRRSGTDLPKQIHQLIIDIQALDDADLAYAYRSAKTANQSISDINFKERIAQAQKEQKTIVMEEKHSAVKFRTVLSLSMLTLFFLFSTVVSNRDVRIALFLLEAASEAVVAVLVFDLVTADISANHVTNNHSCSSSVFSSMPICTP